MKLHFDVGTKTLSFVEGVSNLNANDIMWEVFEVCLSEPLLAKQALWIKFEHAEKGAITKDLLLSDDGLWARLPTEAFSDVVSVAGEWQVQALIRETSTTIVGGYKQGASNTATFTVPQGLFTDVDGTPINNATVQALFTGAKEQAEKAASSAQASESSAQAAASSADLAQEAYEGTKQYYNTKVDKYDENLETEDKTVVGAINELRLHKQTKEDASLQTDSKSVVGAINELNLKTQEAASPLLQTNSKKIVGAINELLSALPVIIEEG